MTGSFHGRLHDMCTWRSLCRHMSTHVRLLQVPMALVSLIDGERLFFKSVAGTDCRQGALRAARTTCGTHALLL